MISYWNLNETSPTGDIFIDRYNGYNGQHGTSAPTPTPTGIVNGGQSFNGADDEINIFSNPEFDFGAGSGFSIEFWIRRSGSIGDNEVVIGRDDPGSSMKWWVGLNTEGKAIFQLRSKTAENTMLVGTSVLNDGNWHHVTAVKDPILNQLRLYADGELDGTASAAYTGSFDPLLADLNIGHITGEYHFTGSIDEVAIYNDVLTQIEIENHHYAGLAGVGYCDPKNTLAVKLFLQGPYYTNGDSMSTSLKTNNYVPLTSPYYQNPRTVSAIPQNVVDWVLLELRSSVSGPAVISKSVFLNKNGNLVADDGSSQNILFSVTPGNYYISNQT